MNRNSRAIECCPADPDDALLIEYSRSLCRPPRIADVLEIVQNDEGIRSIFALVQLEAVPPAGEKAVRGKLRDGVIILDPDFARSLLTKVDAFLSEAKSDSSPALGSVAASVVAGRLDRAVVARESQAMLTPSATPFSSRSARSKPE